MINRLLQFWNCKRLIMEEQQKINILSTTTKMHICIIYILTVNFTFSRVSFKNWKPWHGNGKSNYLLTRFISNQNNWGLWKKKWKMYTLIKVVKKPVFHIFSYLYLGSRGSWDKILRRKNMKHQVLFQHPLSVYENLFIYFKQKIIFLYAYKVHFANSFKFMLLVTLILSLF